VDEAQATEIRDHLLDVDFALQEAIAAVSHLPQSDREALTGPLEKLLEGLHGEALRLISDQHPQLGPPSDDLFTICGDLRWKGHAAAIRFRSRSRRRHPLETQAAPAQGRQGTHRHLEGV
jgi:hypothetical protein